MVSRGDPFIHDPSVPPHRYKEASHTVTTRRGALMAHPCLRAPRSRKLPPMLRPCPVPLRTVVRKAGQEYFLEKPALLGQSKLPAVRPLLLSSNLVFIIRPCTDNTEKPHCPARNRPCRAGRRLCPSPSCTTSKTTPCLHRFRIPWKRRCSD